MKKLTTLTPEQKDRMASFAQEWIQHGWRTNPSRRRVVGR